ncbi:MAG: hypothetical protein VX752_02765 [Actinomycetota bacterium]|nr:hypothetical protein [Actinomycetota bacterium]
MGDLRPDTDPEALRSAWNTFCDRLRDGADTILDPVRPASGDDHAEGFRHLLRSLQSAIGSGVEGGDARYPELAWVHPFKNGQDNPDGLYQAASVDLSNTYRLAGNVGTVCYLGLTLMTFDFGRAPIEQLLTLDGSALPVDGNGDFEIHFGACPAPEGATEGTWFELPPNRCKLLVRQFFDDWDSEVPADLRIDCLDAGPPDSRMDARRIIRHLDTVAEQVVPMTAFWSDFGRRHLESGEVNSFDHLDPTRGPNLAMGASPQQGYGQNWWHVEKDEALLYEVDIPSCVYWAVQLGDVWYQSLDWVNRQSSLNGHQAQVSGDGVFRAVISHRDPGIANWLDTTGATQGCITYRWNQADSNPVPTLKLIPFADLEGYLDDPWIRISPEQRSDVLQTRRRGALRRFRR